MKIIDDTKLIKDEIQIRIDVFMKEQGFQNEFDDIDQNCIHFVLYEDIAIGCCRLYYDHQKGSYILGRIAIIKSHRHQQYGSKLVLNAIEHVKKIGGTSLHLHSQCVAIPFYQQLGFEPYGVIDYDENCPHQWLEKEL